MMDNSTALYKKTNAYQTLHLQSLASEHVLHETTRALIGFLGDAERAYTEKRLDRMAHYHEKMLRILLVLREGMPQARRHPSTPETHAAAGFLLHFCTQSIVRIANLLQHAAPLEEYAALRTLLYSIYQKTTPQTNPSEASPPPHLGQHYTA